MSDRPTLIERFKRARIVRVLLVYGGASWIVLQLVGTLKELVALPEWIGPVTLVLLAVGLVVVLATAWVQSLESTTKAEEAGEVPTDWEVDAADVFSSLRAGRLPHLTWGRAILGGVVAMSLAIGAAGAYVLMAGGGGLIGPTEAGAEGAPVAVAVLPFQTRGADLDLYGEGMVDLLTANLEGLGGIRTINSGTVVARWRAQLGETLVAELDDALRVAGSLNARYAIRGSVVDAGGQVRLTAEVFDVADGVRVDGVQVEGASDEMFALLDALTVQLATVFVGTDPGGSGRLAIDTRSLGALEAYLRGAAFYRQLAFAEAVEEYRDATEFDANFALAWRGLSDAWGWIAPGQEEGHRAGEIAAGLADRLPARERILLQVRAGLTAGSNEAFAELRAHIGRHPDDAEAWNELGEMAVHAPHLAMSVPQEARSSFERAVELQPTFSPYYIHLAGLAMAEGRAQDFDDIIERITEMNPDDALLPAWRPAWDYYWGTPEEMAAAEALFGTSTGVVRNTASLIPLHTDRTGRALIGALAFGRSLYESSFPYSITAIEMAAGLGPARWSTPELEPRAPGFVQWALLTGEAEAGLAELAAAVARGPLPAEAVSAAVLAAWAGDEALQSTATAALPDSGWNGPYGLYGGAADAEEARRVVQAMSLIEAGDPRAAAVLLEQNVARSRYDALSVFLLGQAQADLENWPEAIRLWGTLYRGLYRLNVRIALARAYEAIGDTEAALEGYRGFLTMWEGADQSLPPVVEARAAVTRLGG